MRLFEVDGIFMLFLARLRICPEMDTAASDTEAGLYSWLATVNTSLSRWNRIAVLWIKSRVMIVKVWIRDEEVTGMGAVPFRVYTRRSPCHLPLPSIMILSTWLASASSLMRIDLKSFSILSPHNPTIPPTNPRGHLYAGDFNACTTKELENQLHPKNYAPSSAALEMLTRLIPLPPPSNLLLYQPPTTEGVYSWIWSIVSNLLSLMADFLSLLPPSDPTPFPENVTPTLSLTTTSSLNIMSPWSRRARYSVKYIISVCFGLSATIPSPLLPVYKHTKASGWGTTLSKTHNMPKKSQDAFDCESFRARFKT